MKTKTRRVATGTLGVVGALTLLLSSTAFGAEPLKAAPNVPGIAASDSPHDPVAATDASTAAGNTDTTTVQNPLAMKEEKKGLTTGGVDPHGDSLLSIQNSFQQFAHPAFMLRLFLSLLLAVGCAAMIAWDPRASKRLKPFCDLEERKTLIILCVVGAIVAELSGTSPTLAFVIFGIGALLRFRTVLDNPKVTGKAILVVVIGLACGMGSWTMAVFVTLFSWVLIFWLDSHLTGNVTIRLSGTRDLKSLQNTVESLLTSHRCRPQCCTLSKGKKRMEFVFHMPARLDREKLEAELSAKLPRDGDSRISIDIA
jgi:hypothetical protein